MSKPRYRVPARRAPVVIEGGFTSDGGLAEGLRELADAADRGAWVAGAVALVSPSGDTLTAYWIGKPPRFHFLVSGAAQLTHRLLTEGYAA